MGLTDFAVLEALSHKGSLTSTEIQGKVLLASGWMTAAVGNLYQALGAFILLLSALRDVRSPR